MTLSVMPFQFRALADFASPETKSHYAKGLTYTVREGNKALAALVEKWMTEKKVELVGAKSVAPAAKLAGQGKVK